MRLSRIIIDEWIPLCVDSDGDIIFYCDEDNVYSLTFGSFTDIDNSKLQDTISDPSLIYLIHWSKKLSCDDPLCNDINGVEVNWNDLNGIIEKIIESPNMGANRVYLVTNGEILKQMKFRD